MKQWYALVLVGLFLVGVPGGVFALRGDDDQGPDFNKILGKLRGDDKGSRHGGRGVDDFDDDVTEDTEGKSGKGGGVAVERLKEEFKERREQLKAQLKMLKEERKAKREALKMVVKDAKECSAETEECKVKFDRLASHLEEVAARLEKVVQAALEKVDSLDIEKKDEVKARLRAALVEIDEAQRLLEDASKENVRRAARLLREAWHNVDPHLRGIRGRIHQVEMEKMGERLDVMRGKLEGMVEQLSEEKRAEAKRVLLEVQEKTGRLKALAGSADEVARGSRKELVREIRDDVNRIVRLAREGKSQGPGGEE